MVSSTFYRVDGWNSNAFIVYAVTNATTTTNICVNRWKRDKMTDRIGKKELYSFQILQGKEGNDADDGKVISIIMQTTVAFIKCIVYSVKCL